MKDWGDTPKIMRPFIAHGCEIIEKSSEQWRGTTPFDRKEGKFYVDPKTGLWDNKSSGKRGNLTTFFEHMQKLYAERMTPELWRNLAKKRRLPVDVFKKEGIGWSGTHYMLPVWSIKGTVRDIHRYSLKERGVRATAGTKPQLLNAVDLKKLKPGSRVWFCEGHWDTYSFKWLLRSLGRKKEAAIGTPGANVFDIKWLEQLAGFDVVWCGDNDDAGDDGATRLRKIFHKANVPLKYINWPDHYEEGWDIDEFVVYARKHSIPKEKSYSKLESLVSKVHRRDDGTDEWTAKDDVEETYLTDKEAPTFPEVVKVFESTYSMDTEMIEALKFSLAVVYSQSIGHKEPIWAYLVAAAGGGKTAILCSMSNSKRAVFRSTITPHALVSGFRSANDPSLLPKVNNRTLVIKDFTTVLSGNEFDFEKVMGILRDAYDGEFSQSYGNDITRSYTDLHFSIIAGVTPQIHAKPMALMGERFLKFCMQTGSNTDRMDRLMASVQTINRDSSEDDELNSTVTRFLSRKCSPDEIPVPPKWMLKRFAGLAQVVSMLRAQVMRDKYDRDHITYRPEAEVGTRPFKQFIKLAQAYYFMLRKDKYDDEIMHAIERIAFDSCTGYNIEIFKALMSNGGTGITINDVVKLADMSVSTVHRSMKDLEVLKVVRKVVSKEDVTGRPPALWKVRKNLIAVWNQSKGVENGKEGNRKSGSRRILRKRKGT